jgi:toxin ParE1/3/4
MAEVILSPEARLDLSEAWDYIAQRNPDAADRLLDDFRASAERHTQFPRTGRPRDDLRGGLRSFVVGRYVAFFEADANGIRIIRVLHGSRNVEGILRDGDDGRSASPAQLVQHVLRHPRDGRVPAA